MHIVRISLEYERNEIFSKLWKAVYPPNIAPIGLKFCQNAFHTIPDISFSNVNKKKSSDLFGRETRFCLFSSSFEVART